MTSFRPVVIVKLAGYGRRICVNGLGSSDYVLFLSALEFLPALFRDLLKRFNPIFLRHGVAQSLTAVPAHVVHADRRDGLHSRIEAAALRANPPLPQIPMTP